MSILAVAKNDLLLSPELLEAQYSRRATLSNLASKTALIAVAAIGALTATIVLMGLTLTGASPFLLVGSILTTPFLMHASSHLATASENASKNAENEKAIGIALKDFESLDPQQFSDVCQNLSIDPTNTPYSYDQFNLLMARFGFWDKRARESLDLANRQIYTSYEGSELQKIEGSSATPQQASLLRYTLRDMGFRLLEDEAIPAMLQSALILQVLKDSSTPPLLEATGTLYPKPMPYRLCERLFDNNDVYMTFHDASRQSLTVEEIVSLYSNSGPTALQKRMFA